jgi:hypothetical protein
MIEHFLHFYFQLLTEEGGPSAKDVHEDGIGLIQVNGFGHDFLISDDWYGTVKD